VKASDGSGPRHGGAHADMFWLDLHSALLEQLPRALNRLTPAALNRENLGPLGDRRGVYQLLHQGAPVYIGKSERPLRIRLGEHLARCSGRHNIDPADMTFRCLYVDDLVDAAAPERQLIEQFRRAGQAPWNQSEGFAPRDPGRERDTGRPGTWFIDHPADHQRPFEIPTAGQMMTLTGVLTEIARAVPYDLFRFASRRSRRAADRQAAQVLDQEMTTVPVGWDSALGHVGKVMEVLPAGWQATARPSGMIIYLERQDYEYTLGGWRTTDSGVVSL
jgi:hypothetical protein